MTHHHSIAVIDIETIPGEEMPDYKPFKVSNNASKPETIQKQKDEYEITKEADRIEEWKKQSLSSTDGRILCVGVAVNDQDPIIFEGKEEDILGQLEEWLISLPSLTTIVAHNGLEFDFPFIFHRALKHGRRNLVNIFSGERKGLLSDTMKMLAGTKWGAMMSLDKACKLIGVDGKGDIKGSDVFDYWQQDRLSEIYEYCKNDVRQLRQVYYALKGE